MQSDPTRAADLWSKVGIAVAMLTAVVLGCVHLTFWLTYGPDHRWIPSPVNSYLLSLMIGVLTTSVVVQATVRLHRGQQRQLQLQAMMSHPTLPLPVVGRVSVVSVRELGPEAPPVATAELPVANGKVVELPSPETVDAVKRLARKLTGTD